MSNAGTGIYVRVSSNKQDQKSQFPDLERYAKTLEGDVAWYRDRATGTNMDRPAWKRLEADMRAGKITRIVIWRLDRLGRTVSGMAPLFDELSARKINLVSLREGIDLSTPAGRVMANVIASFAQYETEIRSERTTAGQAVARANGVHMGRAKGIHTAIKVTDELRAMVLRLHAESMKIARIARTVSLSRGTVYAIINSQVAVSGTVEGAEGVVHYTGAST